MEREPRFPGVEWYCDHCGALLNNQKHFNDHKYIWKCKACGFKNSISWDNINRDDAAPTKFLLHLIGFLSYIGFWTAIMLAVSMLVFHADKKLYLVPFFCCLGLYIFAFVLSIVVEFGVRHTSFSGKNLCRVLLRNVKEDVLAPLLYLKELLSNLLSYLSHKIPIKRKYEWYSNKKIIAFSILYLVIFVLEIVALSIIIGYDIHAWIEFFRNLVK